MSNEKTARFDLSINALKEIREQIEKKAEDERKKTGQSLLEASI